jgi:hypothetical protein
MLSILKKEKGNGKRNKLNASKWNGAASIHHRLSASTAQGPLA